MKSLPTEIAALCRGGFAPNSQPGIIIVDNALSNSLIYSMVAEASWHV